MKNIVRSVLVISIWFTLLFLLSFVVILVQIHVETVRSVPILLGLTLEEVIAAAQEAFPVTIYTSILLGLSYTARRNIPVSASVICLTVLGIIYSFSISVGITVLKNMPELPSAEERFVLGGPGLIFSHSGKITIFLDDPGNPQGAQVIIRDDQPDNFYSEEPARGFQTNPTIESDVFFHNIRGDFNFSAMHFKNRLEEGFIFFIVYMISLVFLLSSLRFIMDFTVWPFANLFLGIIAFRGILALDRWVYFEGTQIFYLSHIGNYFPGWLLSPAVFCVLGIVFVLFTIIGYMQKKRRARYYEEDF